MTLEHKTFTGLIVRNDDAFPATFRAWSDEDFRLHLEIDPVSARTLTAIQPAMGKPGSMAESLVLQGTSLEGESFHSDSVEVQGIRTGTAGNRLSMSALQATITFPTNTVARPQIRLWLRGFKSFRVPSVNMSLGQVHVQGSANAASDEVSGSISVLADANTPLDHWVEHTDEFLTYMHSGLAFSRGSRLQAPRLDILVGDRFEQRFYAGSAFNAGLPPIHHLDQEDFVNALIRRFDQDTPFPEILWTVIGWLHADIPFDEARFLMSMTSLEAAVEHLLPQSLTTVIPKAIFAPIRDDLLQTLQGHDMEEAPSKIFQGKIKQLNGRSLSQKLQSLRDHYGLQSAVFTDKKIADIVTTRNSIVHQGKAVGLSEIWPKILLVRELLTQIVFREIGYTGRYLSYIDGFKTVDLGRD